MPYYTPSEITEVLEKHVELRDKLYCRGFLLTNGQPDEKAYPFYGLWNKQTVFDGMTLLVHPKQTAYIYDNLLLVGHAYNPFTMEHDENEILKRLSEKTDKDDFFDAVSELTGVFTLVWTDGEDVSFTVDASGMQTTFYTKRSRNLYVCSHVALLGDLLDLAKDEYVERLTRYRFFSLLGNSLPGDLTPYTDVKRAVPNHFVTLSPDAVKTERFYLPRVLDITVDEIIKQSAEIMRGNMELISRKWKKPAIC